MKMISHNLFLCHFYCIFSCFLTYSYPSSGRSLMTSSDSANNIISLCSNRSVLDFVNHQYDIFQGLIPDALPLRTKEVEIPYFVQNFLLTLLEYMESVATHLTLTFISSCCMRIQSFRRIPSLNALNGMCSMNDMPSVCMLLTFAPNSTDFVSLPLTIGRT